MSYVSSTPTSSMEIIGSENTERTPCPWWNALWHLAHNTTTLSTSLLCVFLSMWCRSRLSMAPHASHSVASYALWQRRLPAASEASAPLYIGFRSPIFCVDNVCSASPENIPFTPYPGCRFGYCALGFCSPNLRIHTPMHASLTPANCATALRSILRTR